MHLTAHIELSTFQARFTTLCEELSAGCDPEFDAAHHELEREFAERRLLLSHFE